MKAEGEWERFTCSGRVSDYLLFKDKEARESAADGSGERLYAGLGDGNGNGAEDDTGRRV